VIRTAFFGSRTCGGGEIKRIFLYPYLCRSLLALSAYSDVVVF